MTYVNRSEGIFFTRLASAEHFSLTRYYRRSYCTLSKVCSPIFTMSRLVSSNQSSCNDFKR